MEGDLKVEHQNLEFKTGLLNLAGNYTEQSIQRVAKSMNMTKVLREKLFPHFKDWYLIRFCIIKIKLIVQ